MRRIVLASSNSGKIAEIALATSQLDIEIIPQTNFGINDAAETGLSFVENALIKARHASQLSGLPALADDSGLIVDVLNGAPGIYSARYAGENATMQANIQKLLDNLKNKHHRQARFYCSLVYVRHAFDPAPVIFEGYWNGEILYAPQGCNGFGYDPIFYVPSHQCSAAELSAEEKNQLSHRGKALKAMTIWLQNQ